MFPLQLLCPPLADYMAARIQVPTIRAPAVGVKTANTERCKQGFEVQQRLVLTPTKDIGEDPAGLMIQRFPQPPRRFLAADKRPHLVQLRLLHLLNHYFGFGFLTRSPQGRVHLVKRRRFFLRVEITVVGLIPSTRAVSRIPLPLSAMSTISRLTAGNRPVL
jgi:hypothetical protein